MEDLLDSKQGKLSYKKTDQRSKANVEVRCSSWTKLNLSE